MAVGIKTPEGYGYSMLPLFDVAPNIIQAAASLGVLINQTLPGAFAVIASTGVSCGVITVKGSAITLAKSGNLGPASKQAIKFSFESALSKAIGISSPTSAGSAGSSGTDFAALAVAMGKTFEVDKGVWADDDPVEGTSNAGIHPDAFTEGEEPTVGGTALMKTAPMKLSKAAKCYQPVYGTSNGSIYFVVARFPGLNIAVRVKNSKVSFRAEGPQIKSYSGGLGDVGFTTKDDYASVHFDIDSKGLLLKTVGAIVGRLGIDKVLEVISPLALIGGSHGN